ncbi:MBL fold metallo-hydrolase [Candidatus Gracilibacteria bacterium]|nr:MBL fold metallo-hydrolase [Candidatus Gracilibacteria bacterium]
MDTLITLLFSIFYSGILFGMAILVTNLYYASERFKGKKSDHFDGKHFYNVGWSPRESLQIEWGRERKGGLVYWLLHRNKKKWQKREITPVIPPTSNTDGFRITNVGHATYLIQVAGLNILTDPVWNNRSSPWSWIGPKRYQDPGVSLENLPKIDVILLSHNHYDHMEVPTLKKLEVRDNSVIYTGLGNQEYLKKREIHNVVDMDWWDETDYKGKNSDEHLHIIYLPAQHFSARGVTDRNRTLWGGFRIEIGGKSLYFAGDTGYGDFVKTIVEKYKNGFDIGLLPIGAYKPRWFMAPVHTDPFEGMQIQRELSVKQAIGIHHSTFDLADDNQDDPIDDLIEAKKRPEYAGQVFEVGPAGTVWNW